MPCLNNQSRRQHGYTLIEMVLVVVLIGILGATGMSMLYDPFATAVTVNATNANASKARYALERIARELRETEYVSNAFCFSSMAATSVAFVKNNNDADCATGTAVSVNLSGTNLTLNGATLASDVQSFSLSYRDIDGNTTGAANQVNSIIITVTVADPDSGTAASANANTQRSRVFLRNAT